MVCPTMQTGFLISLYCFHCSSDPRGGIVDHYGGAERQGRLVKREKRGLSAYPNADRHRTLLPFAGRPAQLSRA